MKTIKSITQNILEKEKQGKLVDMIAVLGGYRKLENPTMSTDLKCMICDNKEHYTPLIDPKVDGKRVWVCAKGDCVTNSKENTSRATTTQVDVKRCVEWPLYCEMNGIGNAYHDIQFENIEQSPAKIAFLRMFASKPKGIIFMQGDPGTGKTFAAMALCELFTRTKISSLFCTQKQMAYNWIETFKSDINNYLDKINKVSLLVIDDFGTAELPPGFLSFFMDVINTRMQWKDRGTVITTNLNNKKLNDYCGSALADRIMTGQQMKFEGKTRRKQTIL